MVCCWLKIGCRGVAAGFMKLLWSAELRRYAIIGMFLLCGAAEGAWAASPQRIGSRALAAEMSSQFAIADFDGDEQADLATVQAGTGSASESRYWIRFELTSGNGQLFGVTGPSGGLQISPRDVNGDHAMDLVVSTAGLNQTIAILLNDGHGNFTLADPGEYPGAAPESRTQWSGSPAQIHENAAIPPSRGPAKACAVGARTPLVRDLSRMQMFSSSLSYAVRPEFGCSSRAPPLAVLHV